MKRQVGKGRTIKTVKELRGFICQLDGDVTLDLGWDEPVDILVMKDDETGELSLVMQEE